MFLRNINRERVVMKKIIVMVLVALLFSPVLLSKEVAGVNVPDSITAGKTKLILNGAGIRKKFFMKMAPIIFNLFTMGYDRPTP